MKWVAKLFYSILHYEENPPEKDQNDVIEIGTFQVSDCPHLVEEISTKALKKLKEKTVLVQRFAPSQIHRLPCGVKTPDEFFTLNHNGQKKPVSGSFLNSARNCEAYLSYLEREFPDLARFFFTRLRFRIPESARKKHTYILGGSGSGKTELMKVLIYPYISKNKRDTTVILFDPHGDVAEQVGRWKEHENGDNLIYIYPALKRGFMPCMNPLEIPEDTPPQMVNYMAECLTEAFKEIVGKESNVTANMGTLLKAVLTVLLKRPDSTLEDFQTFMRDEENEELVEYAVKHSPKGQRHFFKNTFYDKNYTPTKKALYTKLQDLFNSQAFYDLTVGKSTVDLRELMDSKKTVIFNLSKGKVGEQTSSAFGRLLLSLIQGFSFQRQDTPKNQRVPTHIFLDEFHNFVTPSIQTILDESRKYGIHLTLVQQFFGQKTDTQIRESIMNNTAVKVCGTGENISLEKMARVMTGATKEDLQNCGIGEFYIKVKKQGGIIQQAFGTNYARPFRNTTKLLDYRNGMKKAQWKALREDQLNRYYRSLSRIPQEKELSDCSLGTNHDSPDWRNDGISKGKQKKSLSDAIESVKNTAPSWYRKIIQPEPEKPTAQNAPESKNAPPVKQSVEKSEKSLKNDSVKPEPSERLEQKEPTKKDPFTPKFDL